MNREAFEADLLKLMNKYQVPHAVMLLRDGTSLCVLALASGESDTQAALAIADICSRAVLERQQEIHDAMENVP